MNWADFFLFGLFSEQNENDRLREENERLQEELEEKRARRRREDELEDMAEADYYEVD